MKKIALNVSLVPPPEINKLCIESNNALTGKYSKDIALSEEGSYPHLSLAMGCIDEGKILEAKKIVEEIVASTKPLSLNIVHSYTKSTPDNKPEYGFIIQKTSELQKLHEALLIRLTPLFSSEIKKEHFFFPENINDMTVGWLKEYPKTSAFERFNPHFTIGLGENPELSQKIDFVGSNIKLFQLGNYCKCDKILGSINIKF